MPSVSLQQHKAMEAAAHGHSTLGIPEKVGKEFVAADAAPIACAGILLRAPGPLFLLVRNADDGQWVQPGGHVEAGETPEEAAERECKEEVGSLPEGVRWMLRRSQSEGVDFTCYMQDVDVFEPTLDDESTGWRWCAPGDLPEGVHPEVARSIELASGHELDIAKAIRDGELASPQRYENVWLFDIRITGTGTSYRQSLDEYVYRPPEDFLSDDFVQRCNGLPLIFEHPKTSLLDTQEFRDRAIGTVTLPYVKDDEVRGIAKVFDEDGAALMRSSHASTSPAVVFRDAGSTQSIELNDGSTVLIEGKPSYLDHLAICVEGVWDKGGEPTGVNLEGDSKVENEEKVPAWADALGKKLDSVCSRMDAIENKGGDKFDDAKKDSAKKDSFEGLEHKVEGEGYDKEAAEKIAGKVAEEKKAKADRKDSGEELMDARKDSEKEAEKDGKKEHEDEEKAIKEGDKEAKAERDDAARKDSQRENAELRLRIAAMDERLSGLTRPLSSEDRDQLSVAQRRADSLAQMFGDSVQPPLHGEGPIAYRKRLAAKFQKYSPSLKTVKLDSQSPEAFALMEERIYNDAQNVALNPASAPKGRLIPSVRVDAAGRQITTYTGDIDSWLTHFKSPGYSATINRNLHNENKGAR